MAGGYDLSIPMTSLTGLAGNLKAIVDEFKDADGNSEDAADATGHDALRGQVEDFADKWRVKRGDMLGDVEKLQGIIQNIVDTFTQVDVELAKALESASQSEGK